ncbi:mechanosensitive ion channel family protein [Rufibacter glacialis]|uniref:Mechanosensitive ion channel n=1 Tax=Rufibacter glacialis TaxID=1259555 RepID=A0A5M8QNR3_9BACT|nr:mechanosensitive ion channel domain-containing protein [Rufibacter glacialis]KAA6437719.1 mechanosensitive ion channel [Rufibacter glacialis]GGK56901.1 transporter [Rufibacter glacialis]
MFDAERFLLRIQDFAVLYGLKILVAIFLLIIGLWLIRRITDFTYRLMTRKNVDPSLRPFLKNILHIVLLVMLIMVVIAQVGLEITSFIALLGSAGLAVGLALQGSLSNFAGGVLILTVKPFRVGDFIEAQGQKGTVSVINIFNTVINTEDNKTVYLPNGPLASSVVVNYDVENNRRLDVTYTVDAAVPMTKIREVLMRVITTDERILTDPEPSVGVEKLAGQTMTLSLKVWVQRGNYRYQQVSESLNEKVKEAFEREHIDLK